MLRRLHRSKTDMNAKRQTRGRSSDVPAFADRPGDFVVVDESGNFAYHRSEQDLLGAFEYIGEATSVINRDGTCFRLALDLSRHLVLGPALGPVEYHWLRDAWQAAQKMYIEDHRLQRFYAETQVQLLQDLFETLVLEHSKDSPADPWVVDIAGASMSLQNLEEVDRLLSGPVQLEQAKVQDPFKRAYRPVRYRKHWYLPASVGFILYVEIPRMVPSALGPLVWPRII